MSISNYSVSNVDKFVSNTTIYFEINLIHFETYWVFHQQGLEVKGRMVFCPESNSILFIGSPFIDGLDGLTCNNLFISDIPLHDATREVILVGEQTKAQDGLRRRMDKLKNSIEEGNAAVAKERKKNVSLLYLIFPAEIAESLWLGMLWD